MNGLKYGRTRSCRCDRGRGWRRGSRPSAAGEFAGGSVGVVGAVDAGVGQGITTDLLVTILEVLRGGAPHQHGHGLALLQHKWIQVITHLAACTERLRIEHLMRDRSIRRATRHAYSQHFVGCIFPAADGSGFDFHETHKAFLGTFFRTILKSTKK